MAYNLLPQTKVNVPVNESASVQSTSQQVTSFDISKHTLSHHTHDKPAYGEGKVANEGISSSKASHISHDLVEDDYEEPQVTPLSIQKEKPHAVFSQTEMEVLPSPLGDSDIPIRSASISESLRHPAPDLQSLQGAYVKNIERLEESAERLSVTSSLEEELQKMKLDQRRLGRQSSAPITGASTNIVPPRHVSTSSASIIGVNNRVRSGDYPPSDYITCSRGSIRSVSWPQPSNQSASVTQNSHFATRFTEQELQSRRRDVAWPPTSNKMASQQPSPHVYQSRRYPEQPINDQSRNIKSEGNHIERSSSSASKDTYRQATHLFEDFDGIHFTPHLQRSLNRRGSMSRKISLVQPPLANDSASFQHPQPGERMVYYPAPVPVMLNLPQKLSKLPSAGERERRRLKGISEIPAGARKSAAWLREDGDSPSSPSKNSAQDFASLPPQLRASAFFDHPGQSHQVEIEGASAVATLDSILDASAHAPVTAFTDHPVVGHLGKEVYGKPKPPEMSMELERKRKRRNSVGNMLKSSTGLSSSKLVREASSTALSMKSHGRTTSRESKALETQGLATNVDGTAATGRTSQELECAAAQPISPDRDELHDDEKEGPDAEQCKEGLEENESGVYNGPPTTLLAELQMRKAQQKLRNRTAAHAFPLGMHSTLLELDAVAQLQQKSRKQKHITLAWEDHTVADQQNFGDDDVPLGLLMQRAHIDVHSPVGLMEKRDIEDNEPLSRRRAKLRGDVPVAQDQRSVSQRRDDTVYTLDLPGLTENPLSEQEGETLAQRVRRLKAERESKFRFSTSFSNEVSSQLGLGDDKTLPEMENDSAGETLGQRRSRLKAEVQIDHRQIDGRISQQAAPHLKPRHSLADILTTHPTAGTRKPSYEKREAYIQAAIPRLGGEADNRSGSLFANQQHSLMRTGLAQRPIYKSGVSYGSQGYTAPMMYSSAISAYGTHAVPMYMQDPMLEAPLDPKQRDLIDRWRQSVVQ